jgi:hypothetical protein
MALLVFVAVMGIGLGATGVVFHQQAQREKEKQLLFAGDQFRRAIGLYYENSPGSVKRFPPTLNDLLQDERYLTVQRYLRRIYFDPMTGQADWVLIPAPDGGIMGVHSALAGRPIKMEGFPPGYEAFKDKESYAEWKFQYVIETSGMSPLPTGNPRQGASGASHLFPDKVGGPSAGSK